MNNHISWWCPECGRKEESDLEIKIMICPSYQVMMEVIHIPLGVELK